MLVSHFICIIITTTTTITTTKDSYFANAKLSRQAHDAKVQGFFFFLASTTVIVFVIVKILTV